MTTLYFVDSIAHGYKQAAGGSGYTRVGANPKEILREVNKAIKNGTVKGNTVVLSSGLSNNTAGLGDVKATVKALKDAGANVVLLGVADNYKGNTKRGKSMNDNLANVASSNGIAFTGGFSSKDKLHPTEYKLSDIGVTKSSGAKTETSTKTDTSADTTQSTTSTQTSGTQLSSPYTPTTPQVQTPTTPQVQTPQIQTPIVAEVQPTVQDTPLLTTVTKPSIAVQSDINAAYDALVSNRPVFTQGDLFLAGILNK